MVISCWPGDDVLARLDRSLPHDPADRRHDGGVLQVELGLLEGRGGALGLRLRRFGAGALHGNLLRPGLERIAIAPELAQPWRVPE